MAHYAFTDVFDTYVADFHGTTVMLFQQSPDQPVNTAVCYDCHGVTSAGDRRELADHEENLAHASEYHPDATAVLRCVDQPLPASRNITRWSTWSTCSHCHPGHA